MVAGQQQRIDTLFQAQIDDADESPPRRVPNQIGEIGIAQGERAQRRIQMDDVCPRRAIVAVLSDETGGWACFTFTRRRDEADGVESLKRFNMRRREPSANELGS
jgi:hypothetical protein